MKSRLSPPNRLAVLTAALIVLASFSSSCVRLQTPVAATLSDVPVGWASVDALGQNGTTGGAGGPVVTAKTADELKDYMSRTGPYVILVSGTISTAQHSVKSDKTIVGVGPNPTIIGGFRIQREHNVVIRNLIVTRSSYDGVTIEYGAHHVWVDHCDFSECPDGLLDMTHASDYVTVSWNRFRNHNKTCLLGQADDNAREDVGHLTATYHHNWFDGTTQRHPRVRFSRLCHVFNNYYVGNRYGVASTCDAKVLVEGCYFKNVPGPTHVGEGRSPDGDLVARDNVYKNSGEPETRGSVPEPSAFYAYTLDPAARVPEIVKAGAGVGKIRFEVDSQ
ncbi:right-handed parallel beta-helix repeat-containing protein [Candidatus Sumerlaeota bacterium]|nr:right-handed parallel beta-helix repeat-containing protein [Candidatus Sumerlaeota bacterium]